MDGEIAGLPGAQRCLTGCGLPYSTVRGDLLDAAEQAGFALLLTSDKKLERIRSVGWLGLKNPKNDVRTA
jgi:hypothetical protein